MELKLVKNEIDFKENINEVQYSFFKNLIKKDLEVFCWSNKVVKIFGECEIYSNCRSELDSFDYIVSLLTDKNVNFPDSSVEAFISGQCTEYLLNYAIVEKVNLDKFDIDILSAKFTNYLLQATSVLSSKADDEIAQHLQELNEKYFKISSH
jgi:hypothetical protein